MDNKNSKIWTILDIVRWGTEFFLKKGIESARLNIELLLCDLLGIDRVQIYTQFEKPLKQKELHLLRQMVLRRAKREPLQYITGKSNFCGLTMNVNSSVIVPRPETELLVEKILVDFENKQELDILDIGTGSGCIAIAIAKKLHKSKIIALDISSDALKVAKINAERNNTANIEFVQTDILKDPIELSKYDIIVSNPPYIPIEDYNELEPEVNMFEPDFALTDRTRDGLTFYSRFADIFKDLLKHDGSFYLEIGYGQRRFIHEIFSKTGFKTEFSEDYQGIPRVVAGKLNN